MSARQHLAFMVKNCVRALTQIMSAMTARVSLPLAVLVHNVRELSLAFAVAAQCGVVEGALNK